MDSPFAIILRLLVSTCSLVLIIAVCRCANRSRGSHCLFCYSMMLVVGVLWSAVLPMITKDYLRLGATLWAPSLFPASLGIGVLVGFLVARFVGMLVVGDAETEESGDATID